MASKVSCAVLESSGSEVEAYISSKALRHQLHAARWGDWRCPPDGRPCRSCVQRQGAAPIIVRGVEAEKATARKGVASAWGALCKNRFSQPSGVDFTPGVADSM